MTSSLRRPKAPLEFLAAVLRMHVVTLLQSSLVRVTADAFFHYNRDVFFTNPANTLLYQSLHALEERAIVHVAETLNDENGVFGVREGLRGVLDLKFHRHALSHPRTVRWRRPGMQRFFDAKRHWKDNRAAIIWDLQRSVNEALVAAGAVPSVVALDVSPEMALLASVILRSSVKAEAAGQVPSESQLLAKLVEHRDEWMGILERIRPVASDPATAGG